VGQVHRIIRSCPEVVLTLDHRAPIVTATQRNQLGFKTLAAMETTIRKAVWKTTKTTRATTTSSALLTKVFRLFSALFLTLHLTRSAVAGKGQQAHFC